jgi:plastocyanin
MRQVLRGVATLGVAITLAACSGTSPGPGGGATAGAAPCTDSTGPTIVSAAVKGNTWTPSTVTAKVGDVITWTNDDGVAHGVALDDGSCAMSGTIPGGGGARSLIFSVAGSFPFHCSVHSTMKGTITIS